MLLVASCVQTLEHKLKQRAQVLWGGRGYEDVGVTQRQRTYTSAQQMRKNTFVFAYTTQATRQIGQTVFKYSSQRTQCGKASPASRVSATCAVVFTDLQWRVPMLLTCRVLCWL